MSALKLIATDIDGTLFDTQHQYNYQRLNQYLDKLHQKDVKFVVASGNNYSHLKEIFTKSPMIDAFIAENGAQTVINEKTIAENIFEYPLLQKLITIMVQNLPIEKIYLSGKSATYAQRTNQADDSYFFNNLQYLNNFTEVDDDIFKINLHFAEDDIATAAQFLNSRYSDVLHAAVSGFGSIDVIPANTDKGSALKDLGSYYNLKPKQIVTFGDNSNDLEMINLAGLGVAMKNGITEVKRQADLITEFDNDHDGVLETIAKIFQL